MRPRCRTNRCLGAQATSCWRQPRPGLGARCGLVLAANPAGVADAVQVLEQEGVIHLAGAGLVAARVVGKLHMANARQVLLRRGGQFTFHALGVVQVVLHEGVVCANLVEDRYRLLGAVEVEARDVEGVDRLDQQPQPGLFQLGRGKAQVLDEGLAQQLGRHASRRLARQAIELRHTQCLGIDDGLAHAVAKLGPAGRLCSTSFNWCSSSRCLMSSAL